MVAGSLAQWPAGHDPFEPVVAVTFGSAPQKCWREYSGPYRRKAEILAATRRLLAEQGCDRLMLKSVSDVCSVSTQTVHNIFGSKTQLLSEAMNQYTYVVDSRSLSEAQDPTVFLWIAVAYCRAAACQPEFVRQFVKAAFSSKMPLRETVFQFGSALKLQMLRGLAQRKYLRPFFDPRVTAEQIAYVNTFALLEWSENDDLPGLYSRIVQGNATALLGMLRPEAAKDVERWLSEQFVIQAPTLGFPA